MKKRDIVFLNMDKLVGYLCICLTLIGSSVSTRDITAKVCTYYNARYNRPDKCNMDSVQCLKGHIISIKRLFFERKYVRCYNCQDCCENTSRIPIEYWYNWFIDNCNNTQTCVISLGGYWMAKIEYTCISAQTTAGGESTTATTTSSYSTDSVVTTINTTGSVDTSSTTTDSDVATIKTTGSVDTSTTTTDSDVTTNKTTVGADTTTVDSYETTNTTTVNSTAPVVDKINAKYSDSDDSDEFPSVIVVAILIPISALILVAIIAYCVIRKRRRNADNTKDIYSDAFNTRDHNSIAISNQAYTDWCPECKETPSVDPKEQQRPGASDSGYVEITANTEDQDNDKYSTIDFNSNSFPVDAGYGHLPKQKHNTKNTYAHITCGQLASYNDTNYSHVFSDNGLTKKPVITNDENDHTYNTLHTGVVPRVVVEQEVDDEYNHTQFHRSAAQQGSTESCADFGNKNETTYGKPVNAQFTLNNKGSCKDMHDGKAEDEYAACESSDSTSNENNGTSDTDYQNVRYSRNHYFVLQKEDSLSEDVSDTGHHNYFVLEKNN